MDVASDPGDLALRILFLFVYALLFALVEIEIEGPHGWAERLPTWFRVTPGYARVYAVLMRGKPLTGYHAVMFVLPLWSFHFGFFTGAPWSWAAEAGTIAAYLCWSVVWDLLWFLLNPRFGWRRFRREEVWWHDRTRGRNWIGRFPVDYYSGVATSFAVAASAYLTTGSWGVLRDHAIVVLALAGLTAAAAAAAPAYMRWYIHMRRPDADERPLVIPQDPSASPAPPGAAGSPPLSD
jgi:hypothetical protein